MGRRDKKKKEVRLSYKKQVQFDILFKSLIGKKFEIIDSMNKNQIGISGVLVYESFNLLYIDIGSNDVKKFLKNGLIVELDYTGKKVVLNCSLLMGTLVTRMKKLR